MSSYWRNNTVLVSGAGGFIGSHLVEKLHEQGAQVRAFVRYNSRNDIGFLSMLSEDLLSSVKAKFIKILNMDLPMRPEFEDTGGHHCQRYFNTIKLQLLREELL